MTINAESQAARRIALCVYCVLCVDRCLSVVG
jgi:formate hydrogenlyase subunit 6/NADH:ubiquinone oxidoreductase subunit I